MFKFLERIKKNRYQKLYDYGYNWALKELVTKTETPLSISSHYISLSNPFDNGANDAIFDLERFEFEDDRV